MKLLDIPQYDFPRQPEIFGNMMPEFIAMQRPTGKGGK
jgi:hypothetical protein